MKEIYVINIWVDPFDSSDFSNYYFNRQPTREELWGYIIGSEHFAKVNKVAHEEIDDWEWGYEVEILSDIITLD